jgi:hypothetical protein
MLTSIYSLSVTSSNVARKTHPQNYKFSTEGRGVGADYRLSMRSFQPLSENINTAYGLYIIYHVSFYTRMPSWKTILVRKLIYYSDGQEIPCFPSSHTLITMFTDGHHQTPSNTSCNQSTPLSLTVRSISIPYAYTLTAFYISCEDFRPKFAIHLSFSKYMLQAPLI